MASLGSGPRRLLPVALETSGQGLEPGTDVPSSSPGHLREFRNVHADRARRDVPCLFGCPVLDEYSSEELTRIAAQCVHLTYHVFEDINYMEVVDEEGRPAQGPGVLVGTNLHNKAMPMIRYLQNDLGFIETADCACGRRFRALKGLQGRKNDSFLLPSGRLLSSGFLLDATYEFLLEYRTAVLDFCLIQLRSDAVLLEIVPGPGWNADVKASIGSRFRGFLEDGVVFNIEEVKECRKTRSGKRNPIISLVNRPATI